MEIATITSAPKITRLPQPSDSESPPSHLIQRQRLNLKQQTNRPTDLTVAWTSSISHHCRNGQLPEAASRFTKMLLSGVEPNHVTFTTLLSVCADFPVQGKFFGSSVHAYTRKLGLDTNDVKVGTALIDMYAKCGQVELSRVIFNELKVKNSVSWNTMIDGYMRNGEIASAMVLFDKMTVRDAISWTVFIDGFVKKGHFEQGLEWFREMQVSMVEPDYVTIIAILSACANLGALGLGLWIHRYVLKKDFRKNVRICNSLIDMYYRCGSIELAGQVFDRMSERTLVSWNSIIVGFAANGLAEEALEYFELMQKEGFKPDGVSFTGALTACSHAGRVEEGLKYFDIMKRVHKISPRIEHYGCMVDIYSRAGRLSDAFSIVENMAVKPNEVVLGTLLAACRCAGDVELAERLMTNLAELVPGVDSNYVLLANTYARVGRWDGASKVRRRMKVLGIQKKPGISSIEVGCSIHEFMAGDKSHVKTQQIYKTLELLSYDLRLCGYAPEFVASNAH